MAGVDYIICAAGEGKRFSSLGIVRPKPQILLKGKTFLERSLASLPLQDGDNIVVLTQKSHSSEDPKQAIEALGKNVEHSWVEIDGPGRGQLDTFLKSREFCKGTGPIAIWNCDTFFSCDSLLNEQQNSDYDGVVPCGHMLGDHWSFFKTDSEQMLIEAVEKKRICDWASVGYYFFKDQKRIFDLAKEIMLESPPRGLSEYYVSALYPRLLNEGARIKICSVDDFRPFGTPEEVSEVWGVGLDELKRENS